MVMDPGRKVLFISKLLAPMSLMIDLYINDAILKTLN